MPRFRAPAAILLSLVTASAGAQQAKPGAGATAARNPAAPPAARDLLPFKASEKTLPNGLKIIVVPTGFPNIVSIQIPVKTGSRNEVEPGKSGFAHFFEHMMFRGTKAYPPEKYQEILTRSGAQQNAYTTDDYTNYHTTFPKEDLETMLKIEADRFQNLSYDESAFKTEARAVLGEYNKNSANPIQKIYEVTRDKAFHVHTYKHTTMGFLKDIEDMPNQYAYSKTFFDRWYRPEYTTIIVAGDVKPEAVFPLVEKYWGGWKRGSHAVAVPQEPPAKGPVYAHVPWPSDTLPWIVVGFHGPAFSEVKKDLPALDALFDLSFGPTSDLYKKLVEKEQKLDALQPSVDINEDPELPGVFARLKKGTDPVTVRDEILRTVAALRDEAVDPKRLAEVKSNARYGLVRGLDDTERIAGLLARFVRIRRSYGTINTYYRLIDALTPADLQAAARTYLTDANLVLTTLSKDAMPEAIGTLPPLATFATTSRAAPASGPELTVVSQPSPLPRVEMKLLFTVGSAHDPAGKEGLAALTARMIADAGSQDLRIDEIKKALFPVAASFDAGVDREMTVFTGVVHEDAWKTFADVALAQLVAPGFREEDFRRLKDAQKNALVQNLRNNNEEELGKERLQQRIFAGTPYGHPVLGSVAGIDAITLDDVKDFAKKAYTRAALTVGVAGDAPPALLERVKAEAGKLAAGPALPTPEGVTGRKPNGIEVNIVKKETRATAISLGFPIAVTRAHPDFAALSVARSWLGEHRSSSSHLYQRIREVRGMNYGDYAYIEAFPRGMFQFFPSPNVARRAQLFEIWIRPVMPQNAHMALRVAIHELDRLASEGLTEEEFQTTRDYLMKNAYLLTSNQDRQLGYALDQRWYGLGDYVATMREKLGRLTRADVNAAVKRHLQAKNLSVVMVAKDAEGLKEKLVSDAFSPITYDGEKTKELLDEDKVIGASKLGIKAEAVTITPVEDVFAK
ncbi:MAG TPA: pitrilysin family protein [Thermoanaerobaculia bacterium]|nr:pitrilysin family protein [Thermoanaerobaculia bacterium]